MIHSNYGLLSRYAQRAIERLDGTPDRTLRDLRRYLADERVSDRDEITSACLVAINRFCMDSDEMLSEDLDLLLALWRSFDTPLAGNRLAFRWLSFPKGAHVHDVWRWFEAKHPGFMVGRVMRAAA
jgi:hypothetical protein